MHSHYPDTKLIPFNLAGITSSLPLHFIGSRTGATGTLDDLKTSPPVPKAWLNPSLVNAVIDRLKAHQQLHSRLDQHAIIHENLFDPTRNRYRIVWSKNMITSAGVSEVHRKGAEPELVLHLRDGEEERRDGQRYMRQILEGIYAKGGRGQESVEDFLHLILVHEASEIHQRKKAETLAPSIKAEIRAIIEEAKAYFAFPMDKRRNLDQLYKILDKTNDPRRKIYSRSLDVFESIGEENLATIEGLLALIEFVLITLDYAADAKRYHDERTRLQLAKSLYVDILHDFAGSSKADDWVKDVEASGIFSD